MFSDRLGCVGLEPGAWCVADVNGSGWGSGWSEAWSVPRNTRRPKRLCGKRRLPVRSAQSIRAAAYWTVDRPRRPPTSLPSRSWPRRQGAGPAARRRHRQRHRAATHRHRHVRSPCRSAPSPSRTHWRSFPANSAVSAGVSQRQRTTSAASGRQGAAQPVPAAAPQLVAVPAPARGGLRRPAAARARRAARASGTRPSTPPAARSQPAPERRARAARARAAAARRAPTSPGA